MADTAAPPPGLDDFLSQPAATQPVQNVAAAAPQSSAPPPGLEEFIAPEMKEAKYGTPIEMAKTALEGAASGATFGLSTGAETALGLADKKDIEARKETNPWSYGLGQAAGLTGSALLSAGAAPWLGAAGEAGSAAVGLGAESALSAGITQGLEQGLSRGAATAAAKAAVKANFSIGERIASTAVKSAVEGMMVQGGEEISKKFLDAPQTVGSVAANIGLSGILGGAGGAVLGSVSPIWESIRGPKTAAVLNDVVNEANNTTKVADIGESALGMQEPQVTPYDPMTGGQYGQHLQDAVGKMKHNAYEINEAMSRNGLKAEGADLTRDDLALATSDYLSKSGTLPSYKHQSHLKDIYETTVDLTKSALKDAGTLSKYDAGTEIGEGILNKVRKKGAALSEGYEELKPLLKSISVNTAAPDAQLFGAGSDPLQSLADSVLEHSSVKNNPKLESTANDLASRIRGLKNLNDLKEFRTSVGNDLEKALPKVGPVDGNLGQLLIDVKNGLTDLRTNAIDAAKASTTIGDVAETGITSERLLKLDKLDGEYASWKKDLLELGKQAGLGKPSSTRSLENQLSNIAPENLTKKILDVNDYDALRYIKENYPKEFDVARRFKLKQILDSTKSNGMGENKAINPGSFLREISDDHMGPEARNLIFEGVNPQTLKDIDLIYHGALPPNYNPSGTTAAAAIGSMFTPQGLINNAGDAAKYAMLRGLPVIQEAAGGATKQATELATQMMLRSGSPVSPGGFKAMLDYAQHAIKGENAVGSGVKSIFESGSIVLPTKIPDQETRDKLGKKIDELSANPQPLFDTGGKISHYAPDHTAAMSQTALAAVNYLQGLKPQLTKQSPLDTEPKPDPVKQAKYDRALDIAQQPLMALSGIKSGRVTPLDVNTMKTIYPGLYQNISEKMLKGVMLSQEQGKIIPYNVRLGLSTFLGQPLDSTMTAQTRQIVQMANQAPEPQQPGMQQHHGQGPHSMKALSKFSAQFQTPDQARESRRSGRS